MKMMGRETERSREAEQWREGKAKGDKDRMRQSEVSSRHGENR